MSSDYRKLIYIFLATIFVMPMTACIGKDEMRWKEEVLLHDGRTILIDRYSTAAKSGFPNSRRGNVLYQEIRYAPLSFSWSTPATEQPLSFDVIDDSAYFVTIPVQDLVTFCLEKEKGSYQANFYRWKNRNLTRITQQEAPIDSLRVNISGVSQWGYSKEYDPTYLSKEAVKDSNGLSRHDAPPTLRIYFEEKQKNFLLCR